MTCLPLNLAHISVVTALNSLFPFLVAHYVVFQIVMQRLKKAENISLLSQLGRNLQVVMEF